MVVEIWPTLARVLRLPAMVLMLALSALLAGCDATADLEQTASAPPPAVGPTALDAAPSIANNVRIEADVSTRSVAVTSSFTGVEIIVFGAIVNADPELAKAGEYDVVVIIEGAPQPVVIRKKNRVGAIWVNTEAVTFEDVPSFYALFSTEPLAWIATTELLNEHDLGFSRVQMKVVEGGRLSDDQLDQFRSAVIRLKTRQRRFVQDETGVVFVGNNLFRATVDLPANVPVGRLTARVQLFLHGELLDTFRTQVVLQRKGLERVLYVFAFDYPLLYGFFTLFVAVGAGLLASTIVARVRGR